MIFIVDLIRQIDNEMNSIDYFWCLSSKYLQFAIFNWMSYEFNDIWIENYQIFVFETCINRTVFWPSSMIFIVCRVIIHRKK